MSFKIASKFRTAAAEINKVPIDKFPLLLNRLVQRLHIRNAQLFNSEEEAQLKTLFSLTSDELKLILDGCSYIFEQAAYTSTGPEPLYELLLESGFDEAHGKILGKLWAAEAANYIGRLKDRTIYPSSLQSTDHRLNILMGTSSLTRLAEPTAIFEFAVASDATRNNNNHNTNTNMDLPQINATSDASEPATAAAIGAATATVATSTKTERINVEFSYDELYSLLVQLDRVQAQLDSMSSQ